ncbi:F-box/kelch-repeat protein At1g22040 [Dendrobium catenatum]|uniref:F-box/kelch-repeat protein n=1 Tax=Dendrobium catenatum TaxID=906689 RepID=A0A2I0XED5_9ASPA|nr:F-box/kelch-repeat protein At1g22040 [Dendrobium catenatum]XP_020698814.1 F-box/kelch-repeat protein At1g22040 [Dendrobium catenatum]XP_020698816.1 F-box/kelch-repeat protein At1g22040 [Dendrobium catenatum]PKU86276.1 F-box/kelch-repeat protein [Dendrobium catenatum]
MGSFLSFPVNKSQEKLCCEVSQAEVSSKRLKLSASFNNDNPRLISSLPDEISQQILARIPRIYYLGMKLVSRSWKAAITSAEIYQLRKELGTTEEWLYILTKVEDDKLRWHALDPLAGKWQKLPPMPNLVCEEKSKRGLSGFLMWNVMGSSIRIADVIRGWLGRRDTLERLPFCGCAIGTVDGCLYVLGGFSRAFAMKCVWRYDPVVNMWQEVNSMTTGRAFCKASLLNNKLYVVGGVSKGRGGLTPLQSAEVYDPKTGFWTEVKNMPFSKAQTLPTAFLAELLKPIATGMTSYRGKLCVPQSLYSWPFFVDVGGEIYDPETDSWADMPAGMGEGWPARQAGTKLSVVVNGELYALEPSSSLDSGKIKIYDHQEDAWKVVISKVPVHDFTDAESPYLLAGLFGKLHLITKDVDNGTAVLQADLKKQMCMQKNESSAGASISAENHSSSEAEAEVWKVIAAKNFGVAELASCLVLDI